MVCNNCSSPDDRRARCEKYRLSRFYRVHLISKEMDRMTNKKFKLAAMSLALTACVAASPLSAGAEAPEAAADTATEDKPSPETVAAEEPAAEAAADPVEETPAQSTEEPPAQEPEAAPAGDAAVLPALPGARPVVVDMPAAEAPADAAGEPAEAAEDPKDAADFAEETAEDADAAEDAETPEPPEIAIARPDAAQPAVQPGIAAPAIQPGGISVMLPGETRQVALNTQASNEDGTVMGDFETVVKNAKAGQEIVLQEDYTGSLTTFDWIRLNLNKKTVTGTITVDLSGKKADGSRGAVEIVNGTITGGTESGVKITGAEGSEILLKDLTITGNRNDTSGYGGGGVCADSGDLTIDHCRITDNTAANGSGGGVSMGGKHGGTVENASLTIKDSVISGNTSTAQGGGVYAAVTDGSVSITGSTLSGNSATAQGGGISVSASGSTDVTLSGNTILENTAGQDGGGIYLSRPEQSETAPDTTICGNTIQKNSGKNGGGIYADNGVTVRLAGYLLNNHAGTAGADLYLTAGSAEDKNRNVLILRRVSKDDDWTLVDCGHTIDGWYIDGDEDGNNRWNADATVDADGNEIPKFIMNLDTLLDGSDYTILQDENGDYVITVGGKALALKAAHAVIPPEPTPDPEPTPGPNPTPDPEPTPITPETPESPEVPEAPGETPVTPISTPTQTVAPSGTHLPQTGTSLFAALAMALSGIALTAAGAWASLTGRRCRH